MQRRPYGSTGEELSIIGMGGIVVMGMPQPDADRITREAFDRGINYYDVAPSYGDAEDRQGPALAGLATSVSACKTEKGRSGTAERFGFAEAAPDGRFDLYQLHE